MKPLIPLVDVKQLFQRPAESTLYMLVMLGRLHGSFSMYRNVAVQGKEIMCMLQLSQHDNIYCMLSAEDDRCYQQLEMYLPRHLGQPVMGVVVPPSTVFHDCVEKKFYASFGQNVAFIESITHVMNPRLLRRYEERKIEMERAGGGKVREAWLFHGTGVDNIGSICATGFHLPQHKHCLGQYCSCDGNQEPEVVFGGPWTSDSRDRASSSSRPRMASWLDPNALHQMTSNAGCHHYMLLCRVLLGDSAPARQWYEKPPLRKRNNKRYDSCHGSDSWHADQWAVFDESQAYPEYIIQYGKDHNWV